MKGIGMSCILRVYGPSFDVDAWLKRATIVPVAVHRRGEPCLPATKPDGPKHRWSGCNILVSDRGRSDFAGQLRDAARFLSRKSRTLQSLRKSRGVDRAVLDFGVERRPDVLVQGEIISEDVVRIAGRLGLALEISHYPPSAHRRKARGAPIVTGAPKRRHW
jgi:hypothetical protein